MMDLAPVTLGGRFVRLVPMERAHVPALWTAGADPRLWAWTWSVVRSEAEMAGYVEEALGAAEALPFTTLDASTGEVIGSTRFGNAVPEHRRVEIGWTWITPARQRTAANTEAKFLMLQHAFERWGCRRVELKTDDRNERSKAAMLRIGARPEGVFRKHGITQDGRNRDTAWFSIVDDEWPAVRQRLLALLARSRVGRD